MERILASLFVVVVPFGVARAQVANDDCATPQTIVGAGPHAFDTTTATTGNQGQSEALCVNFGLTSLLRDVWFAWTATQTGSYRVSLCGSTLFDSKLAVYVGSACPAPGTAIACFPRGCWLGLGSAGCFEAIAGQAYTIQIGGESPSDFGSGLLSITLQAPLAAPCAPADDGHSETAWGVSGNGEMAWMTSFGQGAAWTEVSAIQTCYGTPAVPGGFLPSGPVRVAVWDDPNDDGDPRDGVLVAMASAPISPLSVGTDVFQSIALTSPVAVHGIFFVGAVVAHGTSEIPAPLDRSGSDTPCPTGPDSWFANNWNAPFNFSDLSANTEPPRWFATTGYTGQWLLRATCGPAGTDSTPYCFGDGSAGMACPCGNTGATGRGCANSVQAAGANLAASGGAIVGADTLVLTGSGMPANSTVLYFQGTTRVAVTYGDGLRCVGGSVTRLDTQTNSGGASQIPAAGDPAISIRGNVSTGATRRYQAWYRNSVPYCTTATFNLTNGVEIVWL